MSAAELAFVWRVPVRTVRVWAVRERWPHTPARPYRYDPDAAQRTYERLVDGGGRAEALSNWQKHRTRTTPRQRVAVGD